MQTCATLRATNQTGRNCINYVRKSGRANQCSATMSCGACVTRVFLELCDDASTITKTEDSHYAENKSDPTTPGPEICPKNIRTVQQ